MKKKILVFNWKMNPSNKKDALALFSEIKKVESYARKKLLKLDFIVAPPAIYLDSINSKNKNTKIKLSGQDSFYKSSGAYTGAISLAMLKDLGASFSIVGHWERRSCFGETNEDISKKIKSLLDLKMKLILCVGEEKRDTSGNFAIFLERQILEALETVETFNLKNIYIAYEPVWAINVNGQKIKKDDLEQVLVLIRKILIKRFGEGASAIKILYGGSVNDTNIKELSECLNLNGFLLGRSSLKVDTFKKIVQELED